MEQIYRDWVTALRSGKYIRGEKALKLNGAYCCLGVLCDLKNWTGNENKVLSQVELAQSNLYLGIRGNLKENFDFIDELTGRRSGFSLASLNDAGCSFDQIADFIEAGMVKGIDV